VRLSRRSGPRIGAGRGPRLRLSWHGPRSHRQPRGCAGGPSPAGVIDPVLGRRKAPIHPAEPLDPRCVDLRRAELRGAQLQKADPFLANLTEAQLHDAQLQGADLTMATLVRADLIRAQLQGSDLRHARLEHADLRGAQLKGALSNSRTVWPDGSTGKRRRQALGGLITLASSPRIVRRPPAASRSRPGRGRPLQRSPQQAARSRRPIQVGEGVAPTPTQWAPPRPAAAEQGGEVSGDSRLAHTQAAGDDDLSAMPQAEGGEQAGDLGPTST
jgi:hypothetical protein